MPTYEYECDKCLHKFETFQSMTDKPLKKCPECGGKVKRLIGKGAGLIFKGAGFYATDYKKKPKEDKKVPSKECSSCGAKKCSTCK